MRKALTGWLASGLMILGLGMMAPKMVHADAVKAVPLSVVPITNEYQVNKATMFYDLEMKPGQHTELQMKLINNGKSPLTVRVRDTATSTTDAGQIDYTNLSTRYDPTLKYPLPTLIKIPKQYQEIKMPAETTATYHLPLTMPKQQFAGIILGGIRVTPVVNQTVKRGIGNTYGYTVAVRLSNGIDQLPSLRLKQVSVGSAASGGAEVRANIQNPKANLLNKGTLAARVTKQGQNRTLKSLTLNSSSVAPNSNFTARVPWNGSIAPGDYTLHATYTSNDLKFADQKVWHFTKNFHVSTVQAARYTLSAMHIPWWAYAIMIAILLLLIVLIWLLLKRRKGAKPSASA
ncbi:DUF916 and DUF3324 domain-containing protein [Lacticaseibacillus baoqingensis]|uniref:DUF916 and DUF3324 domain-containing protein n=1 Tax=Lacticaseibacillus baoqingensis TaxID=2486013 RepID=A0ABW4E7K3_9LACO|nr:DUF916 and DUF3324 domain-containing protein [Lacticaseibacillus baoqingensis]